MEINISKTGLLVAGDEQQMLGLSEPMEITRFAPSVEVAPTGAALVVRIQDASGASPTNYIEATIAAGQFLAPADDFDLETRPNPASVGAFDVGVSQNPPSSSITIRGAGCSGCSIVP